MSMRFWRFLKKKHEQLFNRFLWLMPSNKSSQFHGLCSWVLGFLVHLPGCLAHLPGLFFGTCPVESNVFSKKLALETEDVNLRLLASLNCVIHLCCDILQTVMEKRVQDTEFGDSLLKLRSLHHVHSYHFSNFWFHFSETFRIFIISNLLV